MLSLSEKNRSVVVICPMQTRCVPLHAAGLPLKEPKLAMSIEADISTSRIRKVERIENLFHHDLHNQFRSQDAPKLD